MIRILLFLLALSFLFLPVGLKRLTDGFRVAKLHLEFPPHPEWEVAPSQEMEAILKQRFSYLSKGAQCYAFRSQDDRYVLKIFRYDQSSSKKRAPFELKVLKLLNACKLAYDLAVEETGLLYIHLNPTSSPLVLRCKDKVGRSYRIPLHKYRFAIQRKAKPFRETLLEARQNPEEMKRRIDQFLLLLQSRASKGIYNSDPNLSRNFGFLEDRAVEFDFGNYSARGVSVASEVTHYTKRLRRWLAKEAPEWTIYLDEKVASLI